MRAQQRDEQTELVAGVHMTPAQARTLAWLRADLLIYGSHASAAGTADPRYEYKCWEVRAVDGTKWIAVLSVVGMIGDEGTVAAIYGRDRRHIFIGPRGTPELVNALGKQGKLLCRKSRPRGHAVLWARAGY